MKAYLETVRGELVPVEILGAVPHLGNNIFEFRVTASKATYVRGFRGISSNHHLVSRKVRTSKGMRYVTPLTVEGIQRALATARREADEPVMFR